MSYAAQEEAVELLQQRFGKALRERDEAYCEITVLKQRLAAAEAVCDLVAKIPERPSPSHRIMTPGFDELKAAWEAWSQAKRRS